MRVLLFSDNYGTPLALRHLPNDCLVGIVGACIRPQYHDLLAGHASTVRVPYIVQPKRSDAGYGQFLASIRALKPELLLVNSYSMRLGEDLLALPQCGGINVHGALLPEYRGANPVQWALINNETETGVTMHRLTPEFDAGDVIAQKRVPIHLTDTWVEVQARIAATTDELLREILPQALEGGLEGTPQDERRARHHRRRTPEDGRIDWQRSVLSVYNLVRALVRPHPGAFYEAEGARHVLDTYRSLSDITRLKASVGALSLESGNASLTPVTERTGSLDSVWFTVSAGEDAQYTGAIGLCEIEYRTRTAQFRIEGASLASDALRGATAWVAAYAKRELELTRLDLEDSAARLFDKEISAGLATPSAPAARRPSSASGCQVA